MPPWRKGRGLGPFTSARPAAGPLLSSQLVCPQTTQNSRSRRSSPRPMSICGAWPEPLRRRRWPPFRLTWAQQPVGHGWPYRVLTATAVAVLAGARRLDRRAYSRTRRGCAPGGHPCRLGTDASAAERCFTRRASRPPGSGVGARFGCGARCRRDAAPLRSYGLEYGPEVWRETWRLLIRRREQAPAVSGTKSSSCLCGGCQATGPPRSPASQRLWNALVSKAEASQPAGERALWHCVCPPSSSSGLAPGRH
jgi:hypothetical protein